MNEKYFKDTLNNIWSFGVDGGLHFPLPFMNRLDQSESETFAILLFWAFFSGSIFQYFWCAYLQFLCFEREEILQLGDNIYSLSSLSMGNTLILNTFDRCNPRGLTSV